jgi:peptidyl-prolyl cis-trans isomerase SurA
VGRVNYSMKDSRVTDSMLGLEYDAGCWIARVVAERLSTGRSEATTHIQLQLELVGLSRLGSNPLKVLKDNIPGYRLLRDERSDHDPAPPDMTEPLPLARHGLRTLLALCLARPWPRCAAVRNGDYIVAVINQELVTAGEVDRRIEQASRPRRRSAAGAAAARSRAAPQALDALIEERVIITYARDSGVRSTTPTSTAPCRAWRSRTSSRWTSCASACGRRHRLRPLPRQPARPDDGRAHPRARGLPAHPHHRPGVDRLVDQQRAAAQADAELNIAQILVTVPEGASAAEREAARPRAPSEALARVRAARTSPPWPRELSEDGNRAKGGEIGLRPASRLPDLFVDAVRPLAPGEVAPALVPAAPAFHVLKLLERRDGAALRVRRRARGTSCCAPRRSCSAEAAARRLARCSARSRPAAAASRTWRGSSPTTAARPTAVTWAGPGRAVRARVRGGDEQAAGRRHLAPVVSRFGVHLIQVLERREVALETKQLREQARNGAARAEVRRGLRRLGQGPARPRLRRDARAAALTRRCDAAGG